ncbi:hypothetical protein [Clostridium sp. ZS1]|uniref:hypothetical protein n=1 Tax=Clostridium sp. ZS1 TaxID=2949989 RepID=UPI00207AB635|nr:hypothetical protein [Clostridium sp. ZS1]
MNYEFVIKEIFNDLELFMCFEDEYKMLSNIFNISALNYDNKEEWLNSINDTLEGKLENGDFGVQTGFGADVGKEKTIIYCDFTDEEFEISTEKFKELSEIWFKKLENFYKTKSTY